MWGLASGSTRPTAHGGVTKNLAVGTVSDTRLPQELVIMEAKSLLQRLPAGTLGAANAHDNRGQGLLGELVGDGQDLQGPQVGGLVEDEVEGPDLVRVVRPQSDSRHRRDADPAALLGLLDHPEAFIPVQPLDPLVVDAESLAPQEGGHPPIAIAGTAPGPAPAIGL